MQKLLRALLLLTGLVLSWAISMSRDFWQSAKVFIGSVCMAVPPWTEPDQNRITNQTGAIAIPRLHSFVAGFRQTSFSQRPPAMLGGEDTLPITLRLSEPVIKELELLMQQLQLDDMRLLVDRLLRDALFDEEFDGDED